ncbi:MAG: hypothetical protein INH43_15820 [Acidobacteriaceae bacterium]|nr:hypothetical protein [Acidobacteriaceae bacterium]
MESSVSLLRAGLDAGTAHVRCVLIEWVNGRPRLRSASIVPAQGWEQGRIRSVESLAGAVSAAAMAASIRGGAEIETVTAGYADSFTQMEALDAALGRSGLRVADYVVEGEAALLATTSDRMRQGGISAAAIGVESTELAYSDLAGGIRTASVPAGGREFTEDIASLLDLPMAEAEHRKVTQGGIAKPSLEDKATPIQEILEARAGQYLHMLEFQIEQLAGQLPPPGGVILTGGGACLPGLCDYAEELLQCPVRLGQVVGVAEWPLELSAPGWAVAAGLALHGGIAHGW